MNNLPFTEPDIFQIERLGEQKFDSPLKNAAFTPEDAKILYDRDFSSMKERFEKYNKVFAMEKAGPRAKLFHDPAWCKAAILTAGGLCPGLNEVIKSITLTLNQQ